MGRAVRYPWHLSYGWPESYGPFGLCNPKHRPAHITTLHFESFEAALKFPSLGSWWEIETPEGVVAVSSYAGFSGEAVPSPSLCARQLLHDRYPGLFPESVEEDGRKDAVSHDDGATWESVLLGAKDAGARKPDLPSPPRPENVEILTVSPSSPDRIILTHASGEMTVKVSSLELRKTRAGYSLWVLGTPRGIYTRDVGEGASILLQSLGVQVAGEKEKLNGFVKAWKPALFRVQKNEGEPLEVNGFTRGLLGIDKRRVELSRVWHDYQGEERTYTYTEVRWYLSHLPTGCLIASWKHRNVTEEFADYLRERMPELTDTGMEITPEIGRKLREVLDEFSA